MYLVFAGANYYPAGGWADFKSSHSSLDDAKCSIEVRGHESNGVFAGPYYIAGEHCEWYQIVNARTLKIVEEA